MNMDHIKTSDLLKCLFKRAVIGMIQQIWVLWLSLGLIIIGINDFRYWLLLMPAILLQAILSK